MKAPLLILLVFFYCSLTAQDISNLVPPQVGRFLLVCGPAKSTDNVGFEIFKIDTVTGQVWWINKRVFQHSDGTQVTVTGWELVPTMDESMAKLTEMEAVRTGKK